MNSLPETTQRRRSKSWNGIGNLGAHVFVRMRYGVNDPLGPAPAHAGRVCGYRAGAAISRIGALDRLPVAGSGRQYVLALRCDLHGRRCVHLPGDSRNPG
jgi:hypothetical protein